MAWVSPWMGGVMTPKHTWIALGALLGALGCSAEEPPPGGWNNAAPHGGQSDEGGSDEGGGGAGAGGGEGGSLPVEPACAFDSAFRATGMSFTEPTAVDLALALNDAAYGYDASPITVALAVADGGAQLAASASEQNGDAAHVFVDAPAMVPALVWDGGFRGEAPQASAVMRIDGEDVALENVQIDAKTSADCAQLWVVMDAVIPASQADVKIGKDDIEKLAGEAPSGGWQLRAIFLAESVTFDFGSL